MSHTHFPDFRRFQSSSPHLLAWTPGTWESELDRRGHRTLPAKTMEKREAAKQCQPGTRICHSCTWSTVCRGGNISWLALAALDDEEGMRKEEVVE